MNKNYVLIFITLLVCIALYFTGRRLATHSFADVQEAISLHWLRLKNSIVSWFKRPFRWSRPTPKEG
jgi:hypothetical protein